MEFFSIERGRKNFRCDFLISKFRLELSIIIICNCDEGNKNFSWFNFNSFEPKNC